MWRLKRLLFGGASDGSEDEDVNDDDGVCG